MQICVLNKNNNKCVGIYEIDDIINWKDHGDFILSPRHDGKSGWILSSGQWIDPFEKIKTEQEKWTEIRSKRNFLLNESDKYLLEDYPIDEIQKNSVIQYRQSLRGLPQAYLNADDVIFPSLNL